MGQLLEIVTPLHQATQRDYIARMQDEKVNCMRIAKQYESDYWDGDRRYGYGGYKYITGRWKPIAEELIDNYKLTRGSKVLDVGCGKGFLLYEMKLLEPELEITGFDISLHGLGSAKDAIKPYLHKAKAEDKFNYGNYAFDLVISLGTLHNLHIFDLKHALSEMNRVAKQQYMMVESYRNEKELFNLQCWALTCESFFDTDEWKWLFEQFGYSGDYEFIFFE